MRGWLVVLRGWRFALGGDGVLFNLFETVDLPQGVFSYLDEERSTVAGQWF